MYAKSIRVSAAILAISFALLMASASEARAIGGIGVPCASGRCVRATGIVIIRSNNPGTCISSATVMLDLWDQYVAMTSGCGVYGTTSVEIHANRFRIYFDALYLQGMFMVGLPGFFTMRWGVSETGSFAGMGSFYNHVDTGII